MSKRGKTLNRMKQFEGYLPDDILVRIFQKHPLKSLVRVQCVSKSWQSLITHPSFKPNCDSTSYTILKCPCGNREFPKPDLFWLKFHYNSDHSSADIHVDDDIHDRLMKLQNFSGYRVYGSSHGLVCFASELWKAFIDEEEEPMYLWNPGINLYKKVPSLPPPMEGCSRSYDHDELIGFGFCSNKGFNDYKLVNISLGSGCCGHVNVYSLAVDSWRSMPSPNVPSHLIKGFYTHNCGNYAFVGGVFYWLVTNYHSKRHSLVAFDLGNEAFLDEVNLPKPFDPYEAVDGLRKGCLWVSTKESSNDHKGAKETWVKLFSIKVNDIKEMFLDKRLPYSLLVMLKHDKELYHRDEGNYLSGEIITTSYVGTYKKSLALLGVSGVAKGFPCIDYNISDHDYEWCE